MKNNTVKMIVVLTGIGLFSGAILAVLDGYTRPKIKEHKLQVKNQAVKTVMPANDRIEKITKGELDFYVAYKKNGINAVAFQVAGSGFQSELSFMVGVTPDFRTITGLTILDQKETPGLGTKIESDPSHENPTWFIDQFIGLKTVPEITYVKNAEPSGGSQVQAITGATISSKAVVNILNDEISTAKKIWESE